MQSLLPCVLREEIVFPALAAAWDEEPVVIEPDLVATEFVLTVAFTRGSLTAAIGWLTALSLQEELVVILSEFTQCGVIKRK